MQLDTDDVRVGRVLTRREVLALFGQSGGQLTLAVAGDPQTGYATTFEIGVEVG